VAGVCVFKGYLWRIRENFTHFIFQADVFNTADKISSQTSSMTSLKEVSALSCQAYQVKWLLNGSSQMAVEWATGR
jgi:hypothetical protein